MKIHALRLLPLAFLIVSASPCFAQQTSYIRWENDGSSASVRLSTATNNDMGILQGAPGRSYCCSITTTSTNIDARIGTVQGLDGVSASPSSRGEEEPVMSTDPQSDTLRSARSCFTIPNLSDRAWVQMLFSPIGAPATPASASNVYLRCDETTLFGGFNTSVTDFNFLEITSTLSPNTINGASTPIFGVVTITNVTGTQTIPLTTTFDLSPGGRKDIDIHSLVGVRGFGPVTIIHNGPPGALKAVMAQYNITSTTPLDFEPVAADVFKVRSK